MPWILLPNAPEDMLLGFYYPMGWQIGVMDPTTLLVVDRCRGSYKPMDWWISAEDPTTLKAG